MRNRTKRQFLIFIELILCSLVSSFHPHHHHHHHRHRPARISKTFFSPRKKTIRNNEPRIRSSATTTLFGIKGFRAWFESQFPDATIELNSETSQQYFDHVLIDMNQVLHVIMRRSRGKEHSIRLLMSELDRVIRLTTPTRSLVLAIDGAPSAAKLATQRRRRYGTLVRTEWKLEHFDKLRISKRNRAKRLRGYKSDLKSLEITPCTDFMKSMEATLLYWAWQRLQQRYSKLKTVRVYISPSAVPGEGEVKLLEWILEHGPFPKKDSICFVGGDSDLLLEGMIIPPSLAHNVFVVRQDNKRHLCVSLWETTRALAASLPQASPREQILQLRTDLVLLMILNGNDYLPKLRGARGFSNIYSTYFKQLEKYPTSGFVNPDTLDFELDFCIGFFSAIAAGSPMDLWTTDQGPIQSERRTPLGELNNIIDGGFLPRRIRFRVIKDAQEQEEEVDDDDDDDDDFDNDDDDEEEDALLDQDDVNDEEDGEDDADDEEGRGQVLVRMTIGHRGTEDFLQYETWHNKEEPLKYAKQQLASMALDDFLGTDYSGGTDDFDTDAGITNAGYAWEIRQAIEGKVDKYLAGLLWNLQTYQDGICADYGYNYGRRMSPTAGEIVDFFQEAKADNRKVGIRSLLGEEDSYREPISAGLSCLAALPSQVKHLVPEPYRWLPDGTVENFYAQCMDPTDNVFDMKKFESLCEDLIAEMMQEQQKSNSTEQEFPHGRRIMTGDHYWTVLGKSHEPLTNPFDPPPSPSDELSPLYDNNWIRVSRVFSTSSPRKRSAWGHEIPTAKWHKKRKNQNEIVHSSMGDFLTDPSESVLDVDYKICFPKERKKHMNKQNQKQNRSKNKIQVRVKVATTNGKTQPPRTLPNLPDENVDILERMERFNYTIPSKAVIRNLDKQTSMDVLKALEDVGMVGNVKFTMTKPSFSEFASFNPSNYEHFELAILTSKTRNNVLSKDWSSQFDRDLLLQSRRKVKQHLASLALHDLTGPDFDWSLCSYKDLKAFLMEKADIHETGKISLTERMKEFNLLLPPDDPVVNRDGETALACLKQLTDAGLIGETTFTLTTPSKSKYASLNPENYEHVRLVIQKSDSDNVGVLQEALEYDQDRDINKQTRRTLKQHLASLALCDIIGSQRRWSEMSFSDLRDFLKEKSNLLPPIE